MASDDKKIKTDPDPKKDVPSKESASAVDKSKAEGGKIADAVSYSRGERQKPVSANAGDGCEADLLELIPSAPQASARPADRLS
jgi:hypothetical protein